jgi:hypothetical protein
MSGRKLQTLSLKRKIELIEAVEGCPSGKKKKEIAADFSVPPNTLSTILKNKEKYREAFYGGKTNVEKKRQRDAKRDDVDDALLKWFSFARSGNAPISGPILIAKAESLAKDLGYEQWSCSVGWLDRFKKRHNIVFKSVCGESASVNETEADQWKTEVLPKLLKGYSPRDVYNADETGLFWRLLPDKTMAFKGESCSGGKKSKERVTAMVCANADGSDKSPLLVIGKFQNPRCFKGIKQLPTQYEANRKAWMNSELFTSWLRKFDQKMHRQKRKVLMVVDNCPAHPRVLNLKATELVFLPPNTTSKLQPCDQGIIYNLKCHYRKEMMKQLIHHMDEGGTANDFSISLLDAMIKLQSAWKSVTQQSIANCFGKAGFVFGDVTNDEVESTEIDDEEEILKALKEKNIVNDNVDITDIVNVDNHLAVASPVSNDTIVATVMKQQECDSEDDDDDCGEAVEHVRSTSAFTAIDTLRAFFMQQDTEVVNSEPLLTGIKQLVEIVAHKKKVQTSLLDFFTN